jgi:DUF971 family protein
MPPSEIRLSRDRRKLEIEWPDGTSSSLDAAYLRANCRSAGAVRAALDGSGIRLPDDLRITGLHLVGSYAINLAFSDGDDRGIYPWTYLRLLSGAAAPTGDEDR